MIYEFKCKCGRRFTKNVKLGSREAECACGGIALKVFTVPNISFKGDGFVRNEK